MAERHFIEPVVTIIGTVLPRVPSGVEASRLVHYESVRALLTQEAVVEVCHG